MDLDHLFFAKPKLQSDPLIVVLLLFVGGRFIPCPSGIYRHLRNQEHLDGSLSDVEAVHIRPTSHNMPAAQHELLLQLSPTMQAKRLGWIGGVETRALSLWDNELHTLKVTSESDPILSYSNSGLVWTMGYQSRIEIGKTWITLEGVTLESPSMAEGQQPIAGIE